MATGGSTSGRDTAVSTSALPRKSRRASSPCQRDARDQHHRRGDERGHGREGCELPHAGHGLAADDRGGEKPAPRSNAAASGERRKSRNRPAPRALGASRSATAAYRIAGPSSSGTSQATRERLAHGGVGAVDDGGVHRAGFDGSERQPDAAGRHELGLQRGPDAGAGQVLLRIDAGRHTSRIADRDAAHFRIQQALDRRPVRTADHRERPRPAGSKRARRASRGAPIRPAGRSADRRR